MRRRLLNLLTALSLLLCAAVLLLWLAGLGRPVGASFGVSPRWNGVWWVVGSEGSRLYVRRYHRSDVGVERRPNRQWRSSRSGFEWGGSDFFTGEARDGSDGRNYEHRWCGVPFWWVAVPLAVPPSLWVRRTRRLRRQERWGRTGRCVGCGYDLRASRDRCPECGAAPAVAPAPN